MERSRYRFLGACGGSDLISRPISAAASGAASKTLIVNNLAFSATEDVLQSTFEKATSIRIPQRDGRPKGSVLTFYSSPAPLLPLHL